MRTIKNDLKKKKKKEGQGGDVIGVSQRTACGNAVVICFMNSVAGVGIDSGDQIVVTFGKVVVCARASSHRS